MIIQSVRRVWVVLAAVSLLGVTGLPAVDVRAGSELEGGESLESSVSGLWALHVRCLEAIPAGLEIYMFAEGQVFVPGSVLNRRILTAAGLRWRTLHEGQRGMVFGAVSGAVLRQSGIAMDVEAVADLGDMRIVLLGESSLQTLRDGRWRRCGQ